MAIEKSALIKAAQSAHRISYPKAPLSNTDAETLGGVKGNPQLEGGDPNVRNKQGVTKDTEVRKAQSKFRGADPTAPYSNSDAGSLGGVAGNPQLEGGNPNVQNKQGITKSKAVDESQSGHRATYGPQAPQFPIYAGENYHHIEGVERSDTGKGLANAGYVDLDGIEREAAKNYPGDSKMSH